MDLKRQNTFHFLGSSKRFGVTSSSICVFVVLAAFASFLQFCFMFFFSLLLLSFVFCFSFVVIQHSLYHSIRFFVDQMFLFSHLRHCSFHISFYFQFHIHIYVFRLFLSQNDGITDLQMLAVILVIYNFKTQVKNDSTVSVFRYGFFLFYQKYFVMYPLGKENPSSEIIIIFWNIYSVLYTVHTQDIRIRYK